MPEVRTRSLDGAIYNEVVDAWMIPQADPYTLKNFQKAYDKLAAKKSTQALSKAQAAEFAPAKKLAPTHYALKIYPKTEAEQWQVEMMEDVHVAYIPFDYVQLTQEEVEKLPAAKTKTRSAANTFAEKSPYTVTHDNTHVTDGGPTGPVTYQLPILYTVWPVSKPLPEDLEYVVDYEVFLPVVKSGAQLSTAAMQTLASEATSVPLRLPPPPGDDIIRVFFTGYVNTSDNTLGSNVAMANLKITFRRGAYVYSSVTDGSGRFEFALPYTLVSYSSTSISLPMTFTYQDPQGRWKITTENNTTAPLEVSYTVNFLSAGDGDYYAQTPLALDTGSRRENVIHRAVNYFYNGQNVFPKRSIPKGLPIVARSDSDGSVAGWTNTTLYFNPQRSVIVDSLYKTLSVGIYNNRNPDSSVIQVILHEIGHAFHVLNDPNLYSNTSNFLRESFASYAGWCMGREYYKSIGWADPGGNPSIFSNHARQSWTRTTNSTFGGGLASSNHGWYSPLFVDLTDDYNQKTSPTSSRPNDNITGVSASAVWGIISTSSDYWTQVRPKIVNLVGASADFNEWISNFDTSPVNN